MHGLRPPRRWVSGAEKRPDSGRKPQPRSVRLVNRESAFSSAGVTLPTLTGLSVLCQGGLGSLGPEKQNVCWRKVKPAPQSAGVDLSRKAIS